MIRRLLWPARLLLDLLAFRLGFRAFSSVVYTDVPHELVLRVYCFFFSSRRRHTRLVSDWSSDVCSSDLRFLAATARCKQEAGHRSRRRCGIGLLRAATGFRNWPRTGASRSPAWRRRRVAARPANWRSPAAPRQQPPVAPALRRARGCAPPAAFPTRPTTQPPVHRGFSPSFESNEQTGRGRGVSALCAARSPHRQDRLPHAGPRTQVQHLSQTRIGRLRPSAALLTLTAVHGREQPRVDLPESISLGGKPIKGSLHLHQRHLGHRAARRRTAALRAGWPAARAAPFALGLGNLLGLGRCWPPRHS